ncbi:MAG: DUF4013 domain-containing protein [Methanoregula sp.]|jgi:hypothetical protein|uniref:DUF4013 domain-containing protein n=1 Tax=Methanoregula sp. TaxID=2052170 RepID=UPI0025F7AB3F|nr:DUF4013 domain-containing protein [Methanoregula sp.]MCK9631072.1 DUF4013 domain-containing protein [Methanoregula sp.]
MDNTLIITDAAGYAKEALVGKWTRWLIFVICGLPMALLPFVFDSKKLVDGATFRWDLVPWTEIAIICIVAFLLSFLLSGYLARVYRGVTPPPEFDNWGALYIDGIKIAVTGFIWFIPMFVVIAALFAVIFGMGAGDTGSQIGMIGLIFLILLIEIVVVIVTVLFSMLGIIRCARTGSIREGIRFSAILETIRTIGWLNYLIALVILMVIGFVFFIILSIVAFIPYVGWVIQLVFIPFYSVFSARYLCQVYDHGVPQATA